MAGRKRKWIRRRGRVRRDRVGERKRRKRRGREKKDERRGDAETFQPIEKCDRADTNAARIIERRIIQ